jgi:DNA invertase Pin-like site-specific DNA recombinase
MSSPEIAQPALDARRVAVGYLRRSTDRQEQSLDDQRRDIEAYARLNGFEIVDWYTDDAISGASIDARASFMKMLDDANSNHRRWRFILVYDISRFSRGDLDEAGHLRFQFRQAGVEVIYVNENLTGGDADDLVVGVKQWMAQKYVKDLSLTTIRGQVSHSESGAWCGGTPPYGYDLLYHDSTGSPYQQVRWLENGDKEIFDTAGKLIRMLPRGERLNTSKRDIAKLVPSLPQRIAIVQRIFKDCVDLGIGHRSIADRLNKDGIPSPRNGNWSSNTRAKWSLSTVRAILRNPAYRGDTVWNRRTFAKFHRVQGGMAKQRPRREANKPRQNPESDWIVVPNTHEALVPPPTFDRAQDVMRARAQRIGARNTYAARGLRSPYLLSGLIACGRCGSNYQGRTINSTKRRKDGSKIKTLYYACGGWVMKGNSACEKLLLRKDPLEEALLEAIQGRVDALVSGEGELLLRRYIEEEIAAQGANPARKIAEITARLDEINRRASTLLDGMSPESKHFVDGKLRELAQEKRRLTGRLEELETTRYTPINPDAVLKTGLAELKNLPRLLEVGKREERKEFVRAFVEGITIHPDQPKIEATIRRIPTLGKKDPTCELVAGAGFEPATFGL